MAEKTLSCERSSILNKSSVAVGGGGGSNIAGSSLLPRQPPERTRVPRRTHEGVIFYCSIYVERGRPTAQSREAIHRGCVS